MKKRPTLLVIWNLLLIATAPELGLGEFAAANLQGVFIRNHHKLLLVADLNIDCEAFIAKKYNKQ